MIILSVKEVSKNFANHIALKKISLDVDEGSIFGLLGPNGAGKTTLIRIINQITAPDSGEIFFMGEKLKSAHTGLIGYLPEERGLYKKMKTGEQALYLSMLKGVSKYDAMRNLKYWFERFEIQSWWNRKVEELSKGMQQKVQFIVTIIHKPKLLIFDEPFSGFDPINVNILKDEILNLKNNGSTIIFSTHNMASVEELCDNIVLINKAEKILDGNVKEIKKNYKSNIFQVTLSNLSLQFREFLPQQFQLLDSVNDNENTILTIKLDENLTSNDLLIFLVNYGNIHSFIELTPCMNDIFIETVQQSEKEKQYI